MSINTGKPDSRFLPTYLPYLLRQADQLLSNEFYGVLTRAGIARSDWRVLAVLHEFGDMSVLELATAALSPQPTVTQAIHRLERDGLVERAKAPNDKRQRIVSITEPGSALTTRLVADAKRLQEELLADAGDLSELISALEQLTLITKTQKAICE